MTNLIQPSNSITPLFYSGVPDMTGDDNDALSFDVVDFANMCIEAVYVIDFVKRKFHFVGCHDFFLCGHSVDEVMSLGYDFYSEIIPSKDLPLMENIHAAILQRLQTMDHPEAINYFSFSIHIRNGSKYVMAYHKIKPVFVHGHLRYGICLLVNSVMKRSGHLCAYYFDNTVYDEYKPSIGRWLRHKVQLLTDREKDVLILAKQGKSHKEIADTLSITHQSVRNILTSLYNKFNVNSTMQAVIYATNRRLVYSASKCSNFQEMGLPPTYKRKLSKQVESQYKNRNSVHLY